MKLYSTKSEKTVTSYREELRRRDGTRVDPRFRGGAYGCPGEYFRTPQSGDCRPIDRARCAACWGADYQGEEWIEHEE